MILSEPIKKLRSLNYVRKAVGAHSHLSKEEKKKIYNTYMRSFWFNKDNGDNKSIELIGFNLKYCLFGQAKYLYDELFINQEYAFNCDNSAPFIIDCGCNIGMSILYFKNHFPNAEILGFEPDETAYACLRENIESNQLTNVTIHKNALAKQVGKIEFFIDDNGDGSLTSSIYGTDGSKKIVLDAIQLAPLVTKEVDFLKMDIEGAETEVIEDLSVNGKLRLIKQMSIEYHHHIYSDDDEMSKILSILEENGFGYQVEGNVKRPFEGNKEQGMIIYAYRK